MKEHEVSVSIRPPDFILRKPAPATAELRHYVKIPIPTDKTQVYLHGYFNTVKPTPATDLETIQVYERDCEILKRECVRLRAALAAERERHQGMERMLADSVDQMRRDLGKRDFPLGGDEE